MPDFTTALHINRLANVYTSIVTVMMGAAFIGAIISGPLADSIGRRGLSIICALLSILGDLLLVSANNLAMFYAGRAISGVSVG